MWTAERDAYWASPEGREIQAREQSDEDALASWVARDPGVTVTSHGGLAPDQWRGNEVWTGDDDANARKFKEIDEGEVIAEGTTAVAGYGETPLERARFIVDQIRTNLRHRGCTVHSTERDALELLLGRPLEWCPVCGMRM